MGKTDGGKLLWFKRHGERIWDSSPHGFVIKQHTRHGNTVTNLFRYDEQTPPVLKHVSVPINITGAKREAQHIADEEAARGHRVFVI